jgi:putative oxidoreductase
MAHAFWQMADTSLDPVQLINFFKNVCMAGGLVFIAAAKDQPVLLPRSTQWTHVHSALSN